MRQRDQEVQSWVLGTKSRLPPTQPPGTPGPRPSSLRITALFPLVLWSFPGMGPAPPQRSAAESGMCLRAAPTAPPPAAEAYMTAQ